MTVLVTGGSGFLGSHIIEQLSQSGRQVRALVRASSDTRFLKTLQGVELIEAALHNRSAILEAARGVSAIVHSAGLVKARSEQEFHDVNVGGTENLLAAARETRDTLRRFVFVSSLAAAGPSASDGSPLKSDAPAHPVTRYGRSKRAAERVVLAAKDELPVIVLRPAAIYGPRDREILAFFKAVHHRIFPYFGSAQNKVSLIYGPDCAAACIAAIDADVPSGCTYFIEDGNVYSYETMFAAVERALGRRALIRFPLPRQLMRGVAAASEAYGRLTDQAVMLTRDKTNELFAQFVCDGSEARRALGWTPRVTLDEGARLTADWYREHGWL